jgi:SagB-type dehydrogenase family enzyme
MAKNQLLEGSTFHGRRRKARDENPASWDLREGIKIAFPAALLLGWRCGPFWRVAHIVSEGRLVMSEAKRSTASHFLFETKLDRGGQPRPRSAREVVEPKKNYPHAEKIILPSMDPRNGRYWQLLSERRSQRRYGQGLLTTRDLAALLWAAQGVSQRQGGLPRRAAPSAGALYPLETYVVVEKAEEIARGLYHLDVESFQLEWLSAEPHGRKIAHAALEQNFLAEAAAIIIFSAIFRRTMVKYGDRGLRYIFLDAGHAGQNVLLAAEDLGLAACPVAAFYDDEINDLLLLDGEDEAVIYMTAVGRRAE